MYSWCLNGRLRLVAFRVMSFLDYLNVDSETSRAVEGSLTSAETHDLVRRQWIMEWMYAYSLRSDD